MKISWHCLNPDCEYLHIEDNIKDTYSNNFDDKIYQMKCSNCEQTLLIDEIGGHKNTWRIHDE